MSALESSGEITGGWHRASRLVAKAGMVAPAIEMLNAQLHSLHSQ